MYEYNVKIGLPTNVWVSDKCAHSAKFTKVEGVRIKTRLSHIFMKNVF